LIVASTEGNHLARKTLAVLCISRASCCAEVWRSNPVSTKSYTALQTVRHRLKTYGSSFDVSALWRGNGHRKLVTRFGVIRRL